LVLDNQLETQTQQQDTTLTIAQRSYGRVKQLLADLTRWRHRSAHTASAPIGSALTGLAQEGLSLAGNPELLQTSLEMVMEELAQLGEAFKDLDLVDQQYQQTLRQRQKIWKQVQTNLLQVQMLPVGNLLRQFPRLVRDVALQQGKQVELQLQGSSTLIEKNTLEKLYDPLVHLVRNAIDHGIEPSEQRQARGKPAQALLQIRVWQRGRHIYLEVADDGQGVDLEKVRAKANSLGWVTSDAQGNPLSERQLYDYLFAPNFSTATTISQLSGRGVGLYAVRRQMDILEGMISLQSQPGKGTSFTLRLPLSSTLTKLLIVRINHQRYGLPTDALVAISQTGNSTLQTIDNQAHYFWKREFVPLVSLMRLVLHRYPLPSLAQPERWQMGLSGHTAGASLPPGTVDLPLLLIARGAQVIALQVDEILTEQDLVVKPFNEETIAPSPLLRGCTVLGDGQPVPVLDGMALVDKWMQLAQHPSSVALVRAQPGVVMPDSAAILVVDDSLTIRGALTLTLRKAGYQVLTACDGLEALEQFQQHQTIAGVICDIEMPRMNGLEFLSRLRQRGYSQPLMILSYRNSKRYRQLAEQLGVNAYLTKPYLEQELLAVLASCLA
jgi:two-component system, chemotaxis family, sensor histidine kinase and response regulator PixL